MKRRNLATAAALVAAGLLATPAAFAQGGYPNKPVRLVVPGADCFTSIKWLDRIELRAEPGPNTGREIALGRLGR